MRFPEFMAGILRAFEFLATATLVAGFLGGLVRAYQASRLRGNSTSASEELRIRLSRTILPVREVLVAADLTRTFPSFSMEVETEGELPWRRSGAQRTGGLLPMAACSPTHGPDRGKPWRPILAT